MMFSYTVIDVKLAIYICIQQKNTIWNYLSLASQTNKLHHIERPGVIKNCRVDHLLQTDNNKRDKQWNTQQLSFLE